MSFGEFGIFPLGMASRGLYGALAVIQDIILVITALTIVNVLWMSLGCRKVRRGSRTVRARPAEHGLQESSSAAELVSSRRSS